jgi:hypothetical protein
MMGTQVRDVQRNEACHEGDDVALVFQSTESQWSVQTMTRLELTKLAAQILLYLGGPR